LLSSEAWVRTERASRYLVQLCRHGSQMGRYLQHQSRAHGDGDALPAVEAAQWSDTDGIITFAGG